MTRLLAVVLVLAGFACQTEAALISRPTVYSDGMVITHSALNNNLDEVFDEVNGLLDEANLDPSITFADGDLLSFASVNMSSATEGLILGQATSCTSATAEGQACWDTDDDMLRIGGGSAVGDWNMPDASIEDASPALTLRDTSDNVAYSLHLDTATGQQPYDYLTLFRGTKTSATGTFTASPSTPLVQFNSSNVLRLPTAGVRVDALAGTNLLYGSSNGTLTSGTAGRSLSVASGTIDADAEVYTDTKCMWWKNPAAGDDFKSIYFFKTAATITSLWCESDQTVTAMFQIDDGSPADVDSVDLTCDATPPEDTSLDGDVTAASGDRMDIDVASVASTPTWVSMCFTFTNDD